MIFTTLFARCFCFSSASCSSDQILPSSRSIQNLMKCGFSPSLKTMNKFLFLLSQVHRYNLVLYLFSQMISNKVSGDSRTYSIVTLALVKERRFNEAERFMAVMEKGGVFTKKGIWDFLIQGLCSSGNDPERALCILRDCLRHRGILPSSFTLCSLINSFRSKGKMHRVIEVLELMTDVRYPFDNFVFSSVISGFCENGKPELALGFYENAKNSGAFRPNIVTYTALVSALGKTGRFKEINDLVCTMEEEGVALDVVFYSCWICGYFREGIVEEAFRKHRLMVEHGMKPDAVSYTILINGFSKEGYVEKAVGFLNKMKTDGLEPNLVAYTAIMQGFCKRGNLEAAFTVFRMVEDLRIKVDEVTYAILIDGLCRIGDFDKVFCLLEDMEKKGISPSVVTYNTVINGLCKVGKLTEADEISEGIIGDNFTYSPLLHGYTEEKNVLGILKTKRRIEKAGFCMDTVMCNVLIKALFMIGAFEDAYMTYKEMSELGLVADSFTYCTMIDGYCKVGRINEALEIFDEYRRTPISTSACHNCIIHGLCSNGMVDLAIDVFTEVTEIFLATDKTTYMMLIKAMFEEDSAEGVLKFLHKIESMQSEMYGFICNDAICFLSKKGHFEAALNIYMVIKRKGLIATLRCYYSIFKGIISDGNKWLYRVLLTAFVKDYGVIESTISKIIVKFLCNREAEDALMFCDKMKEKSLNFSIPPSFLKALVKDGRALDAHKLVMEGEGNQTIMDVVDYSILVDGLCKGGHLDKALDICVLMKRKGIVPNIVTYNSVINGLCRQGCLVEAFRLFDSLKNINLIASDVTYYILIAALCEEGFLLDAKQLFEKMTCEGLTPNTRIYNSLIDGYCKFGLMEEGLKLLLELEKSSFMLDNFTATALINGFCRKGDMEMALGFFFEYKRKGILPDFPGFVYLIKGLFSMGRMEEARSILREMLHSESVMELLNKVDCEIETESLANFVAFLCEQGSIQEAISILNEVRYMAFPVWWRSTDDIPMKLNKTSERENFSMTATKSLTSSHTTDLDLLPCRLKKADVVVENSNKMVKSFPYNFDAYYSLIASLCSKGELQKANKVAKEMLSNLDRVTDQTTM